jgi:hypothetical protein
MPATPLTLVVGAVVAVQRSGTHEPMMFEVSILAYVVACWAESTVMAGVLGVLAVAAPIVVSLIETHGNISVGIWILGIAFPWVIGRAVLRQARLSAQLEETRRELGQQVMLEERRRIARDVHDFVGHGLAAVMLQVTSARHMLRRDPEAAEEVLRSAEDVGRRSMQELRRTLALLRSDDQPGPRSGRVRAGGRIADPDPDQHRRRARRADRARRPGGRPPGLLSALPARWCRTAQGRHDGRDAFDQHGVAVANSRGRRSVARPARPRDGARRVRSMGGRRGSRDRRAGAAHRRMRTVPFNAARLPVAP